MDQPSVNQFCKSIFSALQTLNLTFRGPDGAEFSCAGKGSVKRLRLACRNPLAVQLILRAIEVAARNLPEDALLKKRRILHSAAIECRKWIPSGFREQILDAQPLAVAASPTVATSKWLDELLRKAGCKWTLKDKSRNRTIFYCSRLRIELEVRPEKARHLEPRNYAGGIIRYRVRALNEQDADNFLSVVAIARSSSQKIDNPYRPGGPTEMFATLKQQRLLLKFGIDASEMSVKEASKAISAIADRGWRLKR